MELKLSEGSPLDAADLTRVTAYVATHKLTDEQATTLLKDQETAATAAIARKQTVAPDKYELKLVDKSALDPADLDKIAAYAKANKLTQAQAVALVAEQEAAAAGVVTRRQTADVAQRTAWETETKADKDLGGEKFPETLKVCKRAMDRFAPKDSPLSKMLETSGYGNHIEWVRLMHAIGKTMKEDSGGGGGAGGGGQKTLGQMLYPDLK